MSYEYFGTQGFFSFGSLDEDDETYKKRLIELYELESCVKWIISKKYQKVCIQFPASLLVDSVDIAAYIEKHIGRKVYILGDTAYGSCCIDEVGAKHVNGDCVIHFGHACLSPSGIPSFYVFLKRPLDIQKFIDILQEHPDLPTPMFILYDVSYSHHIRDLKRAFTERPELKKQVCVAELLKKGDSSELSMCSAWCFLHSSEYSQHCTTTLQRAYCPHPNGGFNSLIYLGPANANLFNFTYVFKDCKMYHYVDGMKELEEVCRGCISKQLSYLVERIRAAYKVGIVVATLGIEGYKEAVDHAKFLCSMSGKKSYILSIGKPTPSKLANFSEMDIFVAISCPESDFGDKKDYMQPIVGLYELDLALNKARPWGAGITRDFREIIKGGKDYLEPKADRKHGPNEEEEVVKHTFDHIIPRSVLDQLTRPSTSVVSKDWKGLDQKLSENPPAKLEKGRKGGPQTSYDSEPKN